MSPKPISIVFNEGQCQLVELASISDIVGIFGLDAILAPIHVKHPVQSVFDAPVSADHFADVLYRVVTCWHGGNVIAVFVGTDQSGLFRRLFVGSDNRSFS